MAYQSYQLVMKTGPAPGKTFAIEKSELFFGRDVANEVFINDAEVSRRHARLTVQSSGYILEDLGSTNGTFVNGQRLTGPRVLRLGDMIMLGENVSLVFEMASYDPNATMVSAPGTVVAPQPPPIVAPPAPEPAYVGRVPAGPLEPVIPEERGPRRTWLWVSCGCLVVLLCLLVAGGYAFDTFNLYCTPTLKKNTVLVGGPFGITCP